MMQYCCAMQHYFVCIAGCDNTGIQPSATLWIRQPDVDLFFPALYGLKFAFEENTVKIISHNFFFAFEMKQLYFGSTATDPQIMHSISLSPVGWNKGKVR